MCRGEIFKKFREEILSRSEMIVYSSALRFKFIYRCVYGNPIGWRLLAYINAA